MHRMLLVTIALFLSVGVARASDLDPRLEELVSEAEGAGYPATALRLKAREGLAKGVPVERVEAVLRDMLEGYDRARALLPDATPDEVEAAAAALRAGASREAVVALSTLEAGVRGPALRGLADLVQLQVEEAQAVRLVRSASRQGAVRLSGLASAAASLVHGGATPGEAARIVGAAVSQGRDPLSVTPRGNGPGGRGTDGPPDHADKTGKPPHAGGPGKPPHPGGGGRR